MIPGEVLGLYGAYCPDCGQHLNLEVLQSQAGYYLGYWCHQCGPVSRETDYCPEKEILLDIKETAQLKRN